VDSFHAKCSATQVIMSYSRAEPLHCDQIEWDDTGCFVPWDAAKGPQNSGFFQANRDMVVEFHLNVLFCQPPNGYWVACWLMKNVLPPPDGSMGGECAGFDVSVYNPNGSSSNNVSAALTRKLLLTAGDKIWPVPGMAFGGTTAGVSTAVNYFEGKILR
jgi:hypothetical protein